MKKLMKYAIVLGFVTGQSISAMDTFGRWALPAAVTSAALGYAVKKEYDCQSTKTIEEIRAKTDNFIEKRIKLPEGDTAIDRMNTARLENDYEKIRPYLSVIKKAIEDHELTCTGPDRAVSFQCPLDRNAAFCVTLKACDGQTHSIIYLGVGCVESRILEKLTPEALRRGKDKQIKGEIGRIVKMIVSHECGHILRKDPERSCARVVKDTLPCALALGTITACFSQDAPFTAVLKGAGVWAVASVFNNRESCVCEDACDRIAVEKHYKDAHSFARWHYVKGKETLYQDLFGREKPVIDECLRTEKEEMEASFAWYTPFYAGLYRCINTHPLGQERARSILDLSETLKTQHKVEAEGVKS